MATLTKIEPTPPPQPEFELRLTANETAFLRALVGSVTGGMTETGSVYRALREADVDITPFRVSVGKNFPNVERA